MTYSKTANRTSALTTDVHGCYACPRACGVNRTEGVRGYCGETSTMRIARAALHSWEEPCISGTTGSGAVFFTGCVLRCVYCQNAKLSSGMTGREITIDRLAEIFLELQEQKANNINLVTPTHFAKQIAKALEKAKSQGLRIPVVYNTGGYESLDTLKQLEGLVDVYLPDFKYMDEKLAARYSGAADYVEVAKLAIAQMVRQTGEPIFGTVIDREIMLRGVIVRHLMLPGYLSDSKEVVRYLYETYGHQIYLSLMNQYTPMEGIDEKYPELAKKVKKTSYEKLIDYALEIGVENAFIQEGGTASESFIPAFDYEGVELRSKKGES